MKTGLLGRIGARLLTLVAVGALAFVAGIKSDADALREAQNRVAAKYKGLGVAPSGAGPMMLADHAALEQAKAALTSHRWAICKALGLCSGLSS